jgi:radical SAM superfamily enzyme YgiQ (UPF0313 family)
LIEKLIYLFDKTVIGYKMNICLINPKREEYSPNKWPPLGLLQIGAVLENNGENVKLIDLTLREMTDYKLKEELISGKFVIVGLTGFITDYDEVIRISKIVKKNLPKAIIILGGPISIVFPEKILKNSPINIIVKNEGEVTIKNLVEVIKKHGNLRQVKGIVYKDEKGLIVNNKNRPLIKDLDKLPFPARHLLRMDKYISNYFSPLNIKQDVFKMIRATSMITSRGCPYNCIFCYKDLWGFKWRGTSASKIVDEIKLLIKEYNINAVFFIDDTFILNRKRVYELCDLLLKENIKIIWGCNGRVNLVDYDILKKMYDAGCRRITFGFESGSQRILNLIRKRTTTEQAKMAVKYCKKIGISVGGYFMIGMLNETKKDIEETIKFAKELDIDFYNFSITCPMPGTALYSMTLEQRKNLPSFNDWNFNVNVNLTSDITDEELIKYQKYFFMEFTIKRIYGKYFFVNPKFLKEISKLALTVKNFEEFKKLIKKFLGVIN